MCLHWIDCASSTQDLLCIPKLNRDATVLATKVEIWRSIENQVLLLENKELADDVFLGKRCGFYVPIQMYVKQYLLALFRGNECIGVEFLGGEAEGATRGNAGSDS